MKSEPYIRMCKMCYCKSLIVKDGCTECTCPVCDTIHKIQWLPSVYIESENLQH